MTLNREWFNPEVQTVGRELRCQNGVARSPTTVEYRCDPYLVSKPRQLLPLEVAYETETCNRESLRKKDPVEGL